MLANAFAAEGDNVKMKELADLLTTYAADAAKVKEVAPSIGVLASRSGIKYDTLDVLYKLVKAKQADFDLATWPPIMEFYGFAFKAGR